MNITDAIKMHLEWKIRLKSYLSNPNQALDYGGISRYDKCPLGKWIAGDGARYSNLPDFQRMEVAHIRFHIAAADIVRRADNGEVVVQEIISSANSPYARASADIIDLLTSLKEQIEQ